MWIGPDPAYLIAYAAKFTPCMRRDLSIERKLEKEYCRECVVSKDLDCEDNCNLEEIAVTDDTKSDRFSCCAYQYKRYGMMSIKNCKARGGEVQYRLDGNIRKPRMCDPKKGENIVLRPCCVGYNSTCHLYTERQCTYVSGKWHKESMLCSDVACLKDTCNMDGYKPEVKDDRKNQIHSPRQWYRFIAPIFLHAGLIHFVLCMVRVSTSASVLRSHSLPLVACISPPAFPRFSSSPYRTQPVSL